MKTILLTNDYDDAVLHVVESEVPRGFELITLKDAGDDPGIIPRIDYILAGGRRWIGRDLLENAAQLKMIQRSGVGLDSLDLNCIKERRIPLYVNPGINAQSVAEHTVMLILATLKNLPLVNDNVHRGIWKKQSQGIKNHELHGKTVGVVGLGNIGKRVCALLRAFGAEVLYFDKTKLSQFQEKEMSICFCPLDQMFSCVDIITLHCGLTEETRNLVNEKRLSSMKDGAIVINTARGGLVNESSLARHVEMGRIAAGLDVFQKEPANLDNPLLGLEKVIATSHISGITYESFRAMMNEAMKNIALFERGDFEKISDKRVVL
ncbi:hydroxyacid dehydrogenase [Eggerthella guodeyinii]|uniref:Hydroxyacid dehydrogenase n=1 Tax=Eggerthella guodeyinii TaxID=2690837 RepID=A0A6L7IX55_9ACTN|nr:2-hydroxyacid dehydrogenase [Eggerthella guodeyinii]QOS67607.1 hydroxyacid dehydrogenase [Eggerthella guodeyinii]